MTTIPNYKYGIAPKDLKAIRKLIVRDVMYENYIEEPIVLMTLRKYFEMIKEAVLGCCDENGKVISWLGYDWGKYGKDIRELDPVEVARSWMDGRGLFSEHFNSQLTKDEHHYGDWDNINHREQNQWYHEDRLDDPLWFKECYHVIGHAGHPTENLLFGNFDPIYHGHDCWTLSFGTFSRSDFYALSAYKYMKEKKLPVYIYAGHSYLTDKEKSKLWCNGYLKEHNYQTGYFINEREISRLSQCGYNMGDQKR